MKKINIKAFGEGQQIWFNIGRLRRVEDMLKCPIGEVLQDADKLSLKNLLVLLSVGMSQNGAQGMAKAGMGYEEILKYFYDGATIAEKQ